MSEKSNLIWFNDNDKTQEVHVGPGKPQRKIMICTPVHSEVSIHYCQSVLMFQQECMLRNILVSFTLLKSSLVQQGRNLCVADFLNHKDGYTDLLFIDSDIDFQAKTIFKMLEYDKDVIACPYPLKSLNWANLWERMKIQKFEDQDDMMKGGYTFPVKMDNPGNIVVENGICEVTHAPTGCMLIKRSVIEKMIDHYPELEINQPTFLNGNEVKKKNFYNLFECIHDPKTKQYFGEDFGFCKRWTEMGGKIFIYIMDYITHTGEYQYCGRFWDELMHVKKVDDTDKTK